RAIGRHDGSVAPAVQPHARILARRDQRLGFGTRHLGQVVDALLAVAAGADAVVTGHSTPVGGARRRDTDVFEGHHGSDGHASAASPDSCSRPVVNLAQPRVAHACACASSARPRTPTHVRCGGCAGEHLAIPTGIPPIRTHLALVALLASTAHADPKREVPDYDGRGNPDSDPETWVA